MERIDGVRSATSRLRGAIEKVSDEVLKAELLSATSDLEMAALKSTTDGPPDVKIVCIGVPGCGKSALVRRFFHRDFSEDPSDPNSAPYKKQPGT
jgi:GTPase SAR1 family protein